MSNKESEQTTLVTNKSSSQETCDENIRVPFQSRAWGPKCYIFKIPFILIKNCKSKLIIFYSLNQFIVGIRSLFRVTKSG